MNNFQHLKCMYISFIIGNQNITIIKNISSTRFLISSRLHKHHLRDRIVIGKQYLTTCLYCREYENSHAQTLLYRLFCVRYNYNFHQSEWFWKGVLRLLPRQQQELHQAVRTCWSKQWPNSISSQSVDRSTMVSGSKSQP